MRDPTACGISIHSEIERCRLECKNVMAAFFSVSVTAFLYGRTPFMGGSEKVSHRCLENFRQTRQQKP
jgi:hypothetical protein